MSHNLKVPRLYLFSESRSASLTIFRMHMTRDGNERGNLFFPLSQGLGDFEYQRTRGCALRQQVLVMVHEKDNRPQISLACGFLFWFFDSTNTWS